MPRTPKRLFGPALLTNSAATKYTVPAATRTIIREIRLFNQDSSDRTVTVSIGTDAAGTEILTTRNIPTKQELVFHCFIVLEATEVIQALASTTTVVNMMLNGEEITL